MITTSKSNQNDESINEDSSLFLQSVLTPDLDVADFVSDNEEIGSPFTKYKKSYTAPKHKIKNSNLAKRHSIGYINEEYMFVLPDVDLTSVSEEKGLQLDKLNIFKALGMQSSPTPEAHDKRVSLEIIRKITSSEAAKYRHDPKAYRLVCQILNWDTLSYAN